MMENIDEKSGWKESLISSVQFFSEYPDERIFEIQRDCLLSNVWMEIEDRYPQVSAPSFSEIREYLERGGFELVSDECHMLKFFRKGTHLFSIDMRAPESSAMVYMGSMHPASVDNLNPSLIADAFTLFFERYEQLPEIFPECLKEGRNRAMATKIAFPYIKEKIENSHVLDEYEHNVKHENGDTLLLITDFLHKEKEEGYYNWYQLIMTMENVDSVLSRLPAAMSQFEDFERFFPESDSIMNYGSGIFGEQ